MMTAAIAQPASETRVLSLIGVGHFLSHFYILCIPPMLPLLAREFEVGFAMLGAAIAGYAWIGGVLLFAVVLTKRNLTRTRARVLRRQASLREAQS